MAIKRIFSAGGIIVKTDKSGPKVLVTQHSKHKGWDFPKGHIESGESSESAAVREVEEEVGIKAEIIERVGQTQYFYWETEEPTFAPSTALRASVGKTKVLKTVTYYLMKYVGEGEATTAFEVSDKVWLPVEEVEAKLTFKDTKQLWLKVKPKIAHLTFDN